MFMLVLNNHVNAMVMLVLNNHVTTILGSFIQPRCLPCMRTLATYPLRLCLLKVENLQRCFMALESNISGSKCGKTEFEAHGILAIASAYMMIIAKSMLNLKALDMF